MYADETVEDWQGTLEWPLSLEVEAGSQHTSAGIGALAVSGGPKDWGETLSNARLGFTDSANDDQFQVWNSEGEQFQLSPARDNNMWYQYRLEPDLEGNVIHVERNDESWTFPEPRTEPLENVTIVLSGGTCGGCGGTGHRRYRSIQANQVWSSPATPAETPTEIPEIESENPYEIAIDPLATDVNDAILEMPIEINPEYHGDQSVDPQNLAGPVRFSTLESKVQIEAAYTKSQEKIGDEIAGDILLGLVCIPGGPICDMVSVAGGALLDIMRNEVEQRDRRYVCEVAFDSEFRQINQEEAAIVEYAIHLQSDNPVSNWGTGGECAAEAGPMTVEYEYDVPDPTEVESFETLSESICFDFPTDEY